jgi:alkylation response protein AidB-like acyl-CoA dehydrogenase
MPASGTDASNSLAIAKALAERFAATAAHYDETGAFPFDNIDALFDAGLLNLTASPEFGGLGSGLAEAQQVVTEIASGEPSTALVLAMHYLHHLAISRSGTWPRHLAERVTRASLAAPALLNAAQVEPRVGSPSHGAKPETIARRDGAFWRITGHKTYVTGIPALEWIVTLAMTDEPEPRLASFLVPAKAPGVSVIETWNATGMRATASHDVVFERVAVPLEDILQPVVANQGPNRDELSIARYFVLIASVYHGVALAARDWLVTFASTRAPASLGAPLATIPRFLDGIGEIEIRLATNARLMRSVAEDVDAGAALGVSAPAAKHVVIENALAVTSLALDLGGNPGVSRNHPLERYQRDVLCGRAHAPQNNLVRAMAAKAALAKWEARFPPEDQAPTAAPRGRVVHAASAE